MRVAVKGLALVITTLVALAFTAGGAVASTMPVPANADTVNPGVSINQSACDAGGVCFAVGDYQDSTAHYQPLIETKQDGNWTASEAPLPTDSTTTNQDAVISAISCNWYWYICTAVGSYRDGSSNEQGFIDTYSGGAWTSAQVNLSSLSGVWSNPSVELQSISCAGGAFCVAVGHYNDSSDTGQGLLGSNASGSWAFTEAPVPLYAHSVRLYSVDCPSNSSCYAVGSYVDLSDSAQTLIERDAANAWIDLEPSLPADSVSSSQQAELDSISCSTSASCVAVGGYKAQTGSTSHWWPLIVTGSGDDWNLQKPALPASTPSNAVAYLTSVSCPDASDCTAVGTYSDSTGDYLGLIDSQTGSSGTWSASTAPTPPGAAHVGSQHVSQEAVDCPIVGWCGLTGSYSDSSGRTLGLLDTGTSGSWSTSEAQLPAGSTNVQIAPMTCLSASDCLVVGDYTNADGHQLGLALDPPPQPTTLTITAVDGLAYVTVAPNTGGAPITNYAVTANDLTNSARGGQTVNTAGTATVNRAFFYDLTVGDSYTFTVVATNAFGDSPPFTSAVQRIPSMKNIDASLKPLLHPTGGAAKIKALRKSHGFKFVYRALEAGRVSVDWYISTGHGRHKRQVLIGVGVANTSSGAKVPVHVTLNRAGKRLLAGASKLTLSATASFTMPPFPPLSASGNFTLR